MKNYGISKKIFLILLTIGVVGNTFFYLYFSYSQKQNAIAARIKNISYLKLASHGRLNIIAGEVFTKNMTTIDLEINSIKKNANIEEVSIYGPNGELIRTTEKPASNLWIPKPRSERMEPETFSIKDDAYLVYLHPLYVVGDLIGILVLIQDISNEKSGQLFFLKSLLFSFLMFLFIILILYLYLNYHVVLPLSELVAATQKIKDGDLSTRVEFKSVKGHDELGLLGNEFNSMTEKMETMTINLQDMVKEKTKEILDILQFIDEGILTFEEDFIINESHSVFLEYLFHTNDIAGMDLIDFLAKHSEFNKEKAAELKKAVSLTFGQDIDKFNLIGNRLPKETKILYNHDVKQLELEWKAISDEKNNLVRIMLVIRDVTLLHQYQDELILQEKMASIGQLITGVAHELNNPLGAIISSAGNMSLTFELLMPQLPNFFREISFKEFDLLSVLMEMSKSYRIESSRQRREKRKLITKALKEADIPEAENKARLLAQIVDLKQLNQFLVYLKEEESTKVLKIFNEFNSISKMISNINFAVQKMSKIIFVLKAFLQAENEITEKFELGNLTEGVETVLSLYEGQILGRIRLTKYFKKIPQILLIKKELDHVWINLLYNAAYAMESVSEKNLDISIQEDNANIMVKFTDSGIGIPEENKDRIFEPFFTTKGHGEGIGLGLYICRKIIRRHKGEISFESINGKTSFLVTLPIRTKESPD